MSTEHARYDRIGSAYAQYRREDPRHAQRIHDALGSARSVVNVGAGTGSYEPRDRRVVAVEPSAVMAAQRGPDLPPAVRATADRLPLHDDSVDAAMSVLSLHHWDDTQQEGVQEMLRVARDTVLIVTFDPAVCAQMWLMADYFPEVAALDFETFPDPTEIAGWLGGARIETLSIPVDTPDWNLCSYWAHPERVLDAGARSATSGFARMPEHVVERVVSDVRRDLEDGTWARKYGHLRDLTELDVGLRMIVRDSTVVRQQG